MKRYLAILLMLVYTAFSAVMIAQSRHQCGSCAENPLSGGGTPKECAEFEVAGRQEAYSIAHSIGFQKRMLPQHQSNNAGIYLVSSQTLSNLHSDPQRAMSAVPVYVRHCAFLL